MARFFALALLCAALGGCSDSATLYGAGDPNLAMLSFGSDRDIRSFSRRQPGEFLAYEHNVVVDTSDARLQEAYDSVTDACHADRENECTIMNANIDRGDFTHATVSMRVRPAGVDALVSLAADAGEVVQSSTNVEDLAKAITDIDQRIAMLTKTRDRLLELEDRGANDIDALIKITTELTRVQAELEQLQGDSAYQRQRVDKDILTIQFVVQAGRSFWRPIGDALASFGENLSHGLGDTITAIAYLLPWSILLFFVGWLLRWLWKRSRRV